MKIAVLFDGTGLARLGLEQSGHECTGYELDPSKHYLSQFVGSGNCILQDATTVDLRPFDAIWVSPPCQKHSQQNHGTAGNTKFGNGDLLDWSISLVEKYPDKIIWIENVISKTHDNSWGKRYNAAQFLETPIQIRNRIIGGRFLTPHVFREYKKRYGEFNIPPACMASELFQHGYHKDINKERRLFSKWYKQNCGNYPTLNDMAFSQGFNIPDIWRRKPEITKENGKQYTKRQWDINICQAIGNGVPVYMAKAFGDMYSVD